MVQFIFGQNINNRSLDINDSDKLIRLPETFIIETDIDPVTYNLGPADKLGLSIMSTSHSTYVLTVLSLTASPISFNSLIFVSTCVTFADTD